MLLPGMPPIPGFHLPNLPDPFAPNAMVEVNADMFDPLAMPDPSLVEPMDVQIKTEVIDDEPIAMEGSMITDDPFTHPDAGDVSNLMISSVVSGSIPDMGSIGKISDKVGWRCCQYLNFYRATSMFCSSHIFVFWFLVTLVACCVIFFPFFFVVVLPILPCKM